MTRDEARWNAWVAWHDGIDPRLMPSHPSPMFNVVFNAGWDAANDQIRDAMARIKAILEEDPQ